MDEPGFERGLADGHALGEASGDEIGHRATLAGAKRVAGASRRLVENDAGRILEQHVHRGLCLGWQLERA